MTRELDMKSQVGLVLEKSYLKPVEVSNSERRRSKACHVIKGHVSFI